jgi:hypothetical protein
MVMRRTLGILAVLFAAGSGGAASRAWAQDKPCMGDAARLCPDVPVGHGGQIQCLKQHKEELSPACKKKVIEMKVKQEENKQLEQQQQQAAPQPTP